MADEWDREGRPLGHQKVDVLLSLRGVQDVVVAAHHAHTESAVVSARIGGALLYFHDWEAAASIMRGWQRVSREAAMLPALHSATSDMRRVDVVNAVTVVDIRGSVVVTGVLVRPEGHPSKLSMGMGRLRLLIHDRVAYASTRSAFQQAEALCASVLPRPETPNLRSVAMDTVVKAMATPGRPSGRGRSAEPSRPRPTRQPRPSARWLQ